MRCRIRATTCNRPRHLVLMALMAQKLATNNTNSCSKERLEIPYIVEVISNDWKIIDFRFLVIRTLQKHMVL